MHKFGTMTTADRDAGAISESDMSI
jgi:hypothetical protein